MAHREVRGKEGSWHVPSTPLESPSCTFASVLSDGLRGRVGVGREEEVGGGRHFLMPSTLTSGSASIFPKLWPSNLASLSVHHLFPALGYVGGQSD